MRWMMINGPQSFCWVSLPALSVGPRMRTLFSLGDLAGGECRVKTDNTEGGGDGADTMATSTAQPFCLWSQF